MKIEEISVVELKRMMDEGTPFRLIDVREPHEYQFCKIEGAELIPLGTLSRHLQAMDKSLLYILQCRSGGRSAEAVKQMNRAGFTKVKNLAGGILEWSAKIDPHIPQY